MQLIQALSDYDRITHLRSYYKKDIPVCGTKGKINSTQKICICIMLRNEVRLESEVRIHLRNLWRRKYKWMKMNSESQYDILVILYSCVI